MDIWTNSILTIIVLLIVYEVFANKQNDAKRSYDKDELLIVLKVLDDVINNYKLLFFNDSLNMLRKNYDLDPTSKFNSSHIYEQEKNKLIKESSKNIIRLIDEQLYTTLLKYYSNDSILQMIIIQLRGE